MGVRDLFGTLRKLAPSSLKLLPSLSHLPLHPKPKFAIDANLLTTKFHFAPSSTLNPSPNRHVKSWYSFLKDLERKGIETIVVFDGDGRKKEKEKENRKRREARNLQRDRGAQELDRGQRLREFQLQLDRARAEGAREFERTRSKVREVVERSRAIGREEEPESLEQLEENVSDLLESVKGFEMDRQNPVYSKNQDLVTKDVNEVLERLLRPPSSPYSASIPLATSLPPASPPKLQYPASEVFESTTEETTASDQPPSVPDLSQLHPSGLSSFDSDPLLVVERDEITDLPELVEKEEEYRQDLEPFPLHIPSDPLSMPTASSTSPELSPLLQVNRERSPEIVVESELDTPPPSSAPSSIHAPSIAPEELEVPTSEPLVELIDLDSIIARSDQLSKSHLSRSISVPPHVWSDVKELLSAMGVPTITSSSSNPYEAESICSLLYHQSLVTHVISEDTDVLVYDAPLLRRVTTLELEDQPKKRVGYEMSITHPVDVREGLGFEGERGREMFVDWCLLCGTDFTERLPSLGPRTALTLMKKYGSIEAIFEDPKLRSKYFPPRQPPSPPATELSIVLGIDSEDRLEGNATTYERYLQTVIDARRIFLEFPRLEDVLQEGKTLNLNSFSDQSSSWEKEAWEKLFERKEEKKEELEELKKRFGISSWREGVIGGSGWENVDWDLLGGIEMDDEGEGNSFSDEFFDDESDERRPTRVENVEVMRRLDGISAERWLEQQQDHV